MRAMTQRNPGRASNAIGEGGRCPVRRSHSAKASQTPRRRPRPLFALRVPWAGRTLAPPSSGLDPSMRHHARRASCRTERDADARELHDDLVAHRLVTVGISSQSIEKQKQTIVANGLPQQLASDESLQLADLLTLLTFRLGGRRFYRRLTLIVARGIILHVCFPVTIPGRNANEVMDWLTGVLLATDLAYRSPASS